MTSSRVSGDLASDRGPVTRKGAACRFLARAALGALVLLGAGAAAERHLEAVDRASLDDNQAFVQVGAARVRYRIEGQDQPTPTVVLLNGFVAPLEQWSDLQGDVASFAPVLAYDRGGLGLSEGSEAHDAESQAEELGGVLVALQVKMPVVLVSYSASSMVARVFARRHSDLVRGMVFIDPDSPEQIVLPEYTRRYEASGFVRYTPFKSLFDYTTFRSLVENSLGLLRLQAWLRRHHEPPSPLGRFYTLSSHWLAAYREARARVPSAAQSIHWHDNEKTDLPLGVVSSGRAGEGPFRQDMLDLHERLAASSTRGVFKNVPDWGHDEILNERSHLPILEGMVRTVVSMARE